MLKNYEFTKKNNVKLNKFQYENYKKPTRKKPAKNNKKTKRKNQQKIIKKQKENIYKK